MAAHKLIPYWIQVRERGDRESTWDQENIRRKEPEFPNDSLTDYFEEFVRGYEEEGNVFKDSNKKKTFTVEEPVVRTGNTIEGRFKSGEWGVNADFWDVKKHKRIEDAREENHAQEIPYYFLFHIPDYDSSRALLILSKYKKSGIKTLFSNLFLPRKQGKRYGEARMGIEPHYTDKVVEKLLDADKIGSVRFRGEDGIPARDEYADRKDVQNIGKEISGRLDVDVEMKVSPKGNQGSFLKFIRGLIPGEDDSNFDYSEILSQDYDNANVTVVEGESRLTFSLWKEQIQMRMDVDPDEYDIDIYGGYPTPHTIGCVARQLANDLMHDRNSDINSTSQIARSVGVPENNEAKQTPKQD